MTESAERIEDVRLQPERHVTIARCQLTTLSKVIWLEIQNRGKSGGMLDQMTNVLEANAVMESATACIFGDE